MSPQADTAGAASVGVYIHIPWCRSKCDYCAFVSQPLCSRAGDDADRVVDAVLNRTVQLLERRLELLGRPRVSTVYVGGGTPTALGRLRLPMLLRAIRAMIGEPDGLEWSVEANPHSLDRDMIAMCCTHGVTRISVGVQSFQRRVVRILGREPAENTAGVLDDLARATSRSGVPGRATGWSLDLITGVLDMSLLEAVDDAERAVALAPDHISLYDLSVEAGTPLARRLGMRGAERFTERSAEVSAAARRVLTKGGYHRYEISAFSRPGRECRHNRRYWRMEPFVGVGPSAVSSFSTADGGIVRFTDPPEIEGFLGLCEPWGALETVSPSRAAFERAMVGLRTDEGLAIAELPPAVVNGWINRGLAGIRAGGRVVMTETGWDRLDLCLRELSDATSLPG